MASRAVWRTVAGTAAFAGASAALVLLGRLEWMRIDWSDLSGWLRRTEVEVALGAAGRLAALTLLVWIGAGTLAYALARVAGAEAATVRWLAIGPLRRAVDGLLAGYLLFGTLAPAQAFVDGSDTGAPVATSTATVDPRYVPVPAGPAGPQSPTTAAGSRPDDAARSEAEPDSSVVVVSGDHLWGLAAARLREALGREPTAAEVVPYWEKVVDENRDRIRSGDPDLIFPGERIVLPPLPPRRES